MTLLLVTFIYVLVGFFLITRWLSMPLVVSIPAMLLYPAAGLLLIWASGAIDLKTVIFFVKIALSLSVTVGVFIGRYSMTAGGIFVKWPLSFFALGFTLLNQLMELFRRGGPIGQFIGSSLLFTLFFAATFSFLSLLENLALNNF